MPLAMIRVGERARVTGVTGSDAVRKHLSSLGFVPGAVLTVVNVCGGSMILGIHDGRIAINEDLARRVMVAAA
ncbi:MAG: ferrous iron transport protein A [Kiritimatiellae bacterium]|nr:ferrous iron transport protein A [Kiritimatiellia bacterium]